MPDFPRTSRNRVRRSPKRGHYDRQTIYAILDEALICHVAFVQPGDPSPQPFAIPTLHARRGDELLLHGATTSRLMRHLACGEEICVAVTLVDGLVLAKTVFNHSVNYRSVVLFGKGYPIESRAEKLAALQAFTEKILPGRWQDARLPNAKELKATAVVALQIEEASAKVRSGPPKDEGEDAGFPTWAGVIPFAQIALAPIPAPYSSPEVETPDYVKAYIRDLNHLHKLGE
jgi:uncharacterized protein